ncbi:GNAT family N-acetyltransferase [Limobrevibacterium gyesilva]|uniref:GNAT family N-acetyltransferase n=1 Tax=Limobrevibacterium gyesilva TaxID=2991712 RepID=A0AA41YNR2_9PROT|nr:GNAT family N-acetyltransferase [Limobrevibacterium gyesilva]MCW3473873.1 GNAT family N-acetyltransferase [Limobrevibacterium gyesilva]
MPIDIHDIVVRPARAADAAAIAGLYEACIRNGEGVFDDATDADAAARRFRRLLPRGTPFLVACRGRALVGFAHVTEYLSGDGFGHCARSAVWILPEFRGQGVGWALLRDLLVACKAARLRQVVAYVRADSDAALALHAGLGFVMIGWHREACQVFGQMHDVVALRRVLDRMAPAAAAEIMRRPDAAALRGMAARLGVPAEIG